MREQIIKSASRMTRATGHPGVGDAFIRAHERADAMMAEAARLRRAAWMEYRLALGLSPEPRPRSTKKVS